MFTKKASTYFALATVLLFLGLLLRDWQLAILVLPLASLFFLTNVWALPERVELEVKHQVVPSDSFGDEDIYIHVTISNKTSDRLRNVEVNDHLPGDITLDSGASRVLTQLEAYENLELDIGFHSPIRGHYRIGPLVSRSRIHSGSTWSRRSLRLRFFR